MPYDFEIGTDGTAADFSNVRGVKSPYRVLYKQKTTIIDPTEQQEPPKENPTAEQAPKEGPAKEQIDLSKVKKPEEKVEFSKRLDDSVKPAVNNKNIKDFIFQMSLNLLPKADILTEENLEEYLEKSLNLSLSIIDKWENIWEKRLEESEKKKKD